MENKQEEYRIPDSPYQPVQEVPQRNIKQSKAEGTIGKIVMAVFACVFVFIGLIFLIILAAPYLNEWLKVGGMYVVSIGMTLAGTILSVRNRANKAFLTIAACGMGILYISIVFSKTYFGILTDFSLYILILVWAGICCLLSKLRSVVFHIIGQCGLWVSLVAGMITCSGKPNTDLALLILSVYLIAMLVFFASHMQRGYTANRISLIASMAGMITIGFALKSILWSASDAVYYWVTNVLAVIALIPYLCGMLVLKKDTKHAVEFGLYSLVYLFLFFRFIDIPGIYVADIITFGITVVSLLLLEAKFREENFAGKIILQVLLLVTLMVQCLEIDPLRRYNMIALIALASILYGFFRKNLAYKITGLVYSLVFCLLAGGRGTYDWLHLALGIVLCLVIHFLITKKKEQYYPVYRILTHVALFWIVGMDLGRIIIRSHLFTGLQNAVMIVTALAIINTIGTKLPLFYKNPVTGEKQQGMLLTTYLMNIPLMIAVLILIGMAKDPLMQTLTIVLGVFVYAVNSVDLIIQREKTGVALYVMLKWVVLLNVCLYSCGVFNIVISVVGIVYAMLWIIAGFMMSRKFNRNYLAVRIAGLVLVIVDLFKILLIDVHYSEMLYRAVSFLIAGGLCFGISMIYSRIEKKLR